MKSILQDAQDNWPEDEAAVTVSTYKERLKDCEWPSDRLYETECFERDKKHMESVFMKESDGKELCERYHAEIEKQLKTVV